MVPAMATWEQSTDAELIEACDAGDPDAFAELYHRHRDWVVRLARQFTRDDHLAVEVMQDTFAHLLSRFPGFRLTARLRTYLYPVVRNLSITAARRRRRDLAAGPDAGSPVAPADDAATDHAGLARAIADLPDTQREVLLMRVVHGLAVAEIAIALGIPRGTVKSRLHAALETLRKDPRTRDLFPAE